MSLASNDWDKQAWLCEVFEDVVDCSHPMVMMTMMIRCRESGAQSQQWRQTKHFPTAEAAGAGSSTPSNQKEQQTLTVVVTWSAHLHVHVYGIRASTHNGPGCG